MKNFALILSLISFSNFNQACKDHDDLDYPKNWEKIQKVNLTKAVPPNGKFARIHTLDSNEIKVLISALNVSKPAGRVERFQNPVRLDLVSKQGKKYPLLYEDEKIRDFNSDFTYSIERVPFLENF